MIDARSDLYDEIARAVLAAFPGAYVSSEHVISPPMFPAVFVEQAASAELDSSRDSSLAENANTLTFTVNVYSNSKSNAKQECTAILQVIDERMRIRNMRRVTARPIDNAADPSIYRLIGRYTGEIGRAHV